MWPRPPSSLSSSSAAVRSSPSARSSRRWSSTSASRSRSFTDAGLHFKKPFVESVVYLDNRILDLETPQQEVLASDNQRILVDAFVRYHIVDPLKFYQSVGTVERANNQLASVLSSALRRVLGEATLPQIVRDERAQLMVKIRDLVNGEGGRLGVAVNDVRIRRADLPRELSEKVFSRMQTERAREAAEYRAQGSEQAQTITANADREAVVIRAEAQRQADTLRGAGEAEAQPHLRGSVRQGPRLLRFLPHHAGLCGGPEVRAYAVRRSRRTGISSAI